MSAARPLPTPALPSWVRQPDGRLTPFDADAVSQRLFAATETLGRPDAFLARELTDGVLYFLAADGPGPVIAADELADTVAKVVRELRQPAVARAYAAAAPAPVAVQVRLDPGASPWEFLQTSLREYSLEAVFGRDLAAAHRDGLLTLIGLTAPLDFLARSADEVPDAPAAGTSEELIRALDAPEYDAGPPAWEALPPGRWVVNANTTPPPPRVIHGAEGPLFGHADSADAVEERREALVSYFACGPLRTDVALHWHVAEADLREANSRRRLVRLAQAALDGRHSAFTFDRPRRPVALGAGLDRRRPAVLMAVALHLPRLLEMPDVATDLERFLAKLGSLARMALSAGNQKRAFLRKHAAGLRSGFLIDRARLVVVPVGLGAVVRAYKWSAATAAEANALAARIVHRLHEALHEGSGALLDACLETPAEFGLDDPAADQSPATSLPAQLQAVAAGTLVLRLPDPPPSAEELVELLPRVLRNTGVVRLRWRRSLPDRQAILLGE